MKQARVHPSETKLGTSPSLPDHVFSVRGQLYRKGQVLRVFLHERDLLTKRELEAKRKNEKRRSQELQQEQLKDVECALNLVESAAVRTSPLQKLWRSPALCSVEGFDEESCMHVLRIISPPENNGKCDIGERPFDKALDEDKFVPHHELVKCRLEDREHYCEAAVMGLRESLDVVTRSDAESDTSTSLCPSALAVRKASFDGMLAPGMYFIGSNNTGSLQQTITIRLPLEKLLELRAHTSLRYIAPAFSILRGTERIGDVEIPPLSWKSRHNVLATTNGNSPKETSRSHQLSLENALDLSAMKLEHPINEGDPELFIHLVSSPASRATWDHYNHSFKCGSLSFALRPLCELHEIHAELARLSDDVASKDLLSSTASTRRQMKRVEVQERISRIAAENRIDPIKLQQGLKNHNRFQARKPKKALMCSNLDEITKAYRVCLNEAHRQLDETTKEIKEIIIQLHKKYEKEKNKQIHRENLAFQKAEAGHLGSAAEVAEHISFSGLSGSFAKLMGAYELVPLHDTSDTERIDKRRSVKKSMIKRLVNGAHLYRKMGADSAHFLYKDMVSGRWNLVDVSNPNDAVLAPQHNSFSDARQSRDPFAPLAYYRKEALIEAFEIGEASIRSSISTSLPNDPGLPWEILVSGEAQPKNTYWKVDQKIKVLQGIGQFPPFVKFIGHKYSRSAFMGIYIRENRYVHGVPLYRQHTFDCETEALLPASEDGEYEDALALGFKTHGEMEKCKAMGFTAVEKSAYDECLAWGFQSKNDYDDFKLSRIGRFCYRCSASGRWLLIDDGDEATFAVNAAAIRTTLPVEGPPSDESLVWEFLAPCNIEAAEGVGRWIIDSDLKCKMRSSLEEADTSDEEDNEIKDRGDKAMRIKVNLLSNEEGSVTNNLALETKEQDKKLAKIAAEIKRWECRGRDVVKERKRLNEEDSLARIDRAARSLYIVMSLIQEAVTLNKVVPVYQRGSKVMLLDTNRCSNPISPFTGIDGVVRALDPCGNYLVSFDAIGSRQESILNSLSISSHRPSVRIFFCAGAELAIYLEDGGWTDSVVIESDDDQNEIEVCNLLLLDPPSANSFTESIAKTSSGYGQSSSLMPSAAKKSGYKTVKLCLNPCNHYRRRLRQHEYSAERSAYFDEYRDEIALPASYVIDPASGKILNVRNDLIRYMRLKSNDDTAIFESVEDIAKFMATSIGSKRISGFVESLPILVHGPSGSGKTWLMRQWLLLVADAASNAGRDGMVPLLINGAQLQHVVNGGSDITSGKMSLIGPDGLEGFMNGRRSLFQAFLEGAFGPGGCGAVGCGGGDNSSRSSIDRKGRLNFLLDALESKRLIVGIDGLEQAGDRRWSFENEIIDELVARGCRVLASIRSECLALDKCKPWQLFKLMSLSVEQQHQLVRNRFGGIEESSSFINMMNSCETGNIIMDELFERVTAKERSSQSSYDHNGNQILKGVPGIQDFGRGSDRPLQDGSWRDTDLRRNLHEHRRLAEKAKILIGLEVEKALSSSNAIRKSGTTHEFQVIVNDLKSESWVAENANKRAALHQASLGVATCLDCCTVDVLCGPGLDAVSVGLESFREHDRFQVVRIKNLFCPSNLEVQRFRRLLVSLRVFDIEESLTAKQAKSPSKSHVVEVTLHLKDIFDAYTTQPMLFKDPFLYFSRFIGNEVRDVDSREAWVALGDRLEVLKSIVRSPLLLSFLIFAMQQNRIEVSCVILPTSAAALLKMVVEKQLPLSVAPPKVNIMQSIQCFQSDKALENIDLAAQTVNADKGVDNGVDDVSVNTANNDRLRAPEDVPITENCEAEVPKLVQPQTVMPLQTQLTLALEHMAFKHFSQRKQLFNMTEALRANTKLISQGGSRRNASRAGIDSFWRKLSDEGNLPFIVAINFPSRSELEEEQLGLNSGGAAGLNTRTKTNFMPAHKCIYGFSDRSIQEYLAARCLLQRVDAAANETIDDIIIRLQLHVKLAIPKTQSQNLQQFSTMQEAENKKRAIKTAEVAALTLAATLKQKKLAEASFGNTSERRINPVWLSDGYFQNLLKYLHELPHSAEILFPDAQEDRIATEQTWSRSKLFKSFGATFSEVFSKAMIDSNSCGPLRGKRLRGPDTNLVEEVDLFEHRAYRSSNLYGPKALSMLVMLGGKRLITVDCSGSIGLMGSIDPFEQCLSLQYLSLKDCKGICGSIKASNMALLCRLRYFNFAGTSIECSDLPGWLACSLTNVHSQKKISQLPQSISGNLEVLKSFRHLKILSLLNLSSIRGFEELITATPKLEHLEIVDCSELSGQLEDKSVSWLTAIKEKQLKNIGSLSIHPNFLGATMTIIELNHVSALEFQLDSFVGCAALRELRLRNCEGLSGTLEPLRGLKETLEVLDLDGCGGGNEGEGPGGGYVTKEHQIEVAINPHKIDDDARGRARPWGGRGPKGPVEVLTALTKLRWLHLCGNGGLTGELSAGLVKSISDMRRNFGRSAVNMMGVGALTLEDDLEDEAAIGMLTIDLSEIPSIDGSVCALYECINLRELHFEYTNLYGSIDDLHTITGLVICDLSDCQHIVGSLFMFNSMPLLEELDLRRCQRVEGDLEPLTACIQLKELLLSSCPGIKGTLSAAVVAMISRIRNSYGQSAVDLRDCGPLQLIDFDFDKNVDIENQTSNYHVDETSVSAVDRSDDEPLQEVQSEIINESSFYAANEVETESAEASGKLEREEAAEIEKGSLDITAPSILKSQNRKNATSKSAMAFKDTTSIDLGNIPSLFGDISVLSRCPMLQKNCRYLCLAQCPLVGGSFKSLEPMKKLDSILLGGCAALDCSEALDHLGNWAVSSKLECIGLSATSLTGSIEPLKALTSVNVLDLSGCSVNGKLEHLHTCNKLGFLNITGCQNIQGAEKFAKKHPACEILSGDF